MALGSSRFQSAFRKFNAMLIPGPWCLPCVSCLGFLRTFFFIPNIQKFHSGLLWCGLFFIYCSEYWWAISAWKLMAFSSGKVSYIIWFFTSICLLGVLSGTSISQRSDLNWSSTFKNLFSLIFLVLFVCFCCCSTEDFLNFLNSSFFPINFFILHLYF